jgi:hypothetical protein
VSRKIAASLSSFKVEVKPTEKPGATTLSITTLIIMTFRITILSIKGLFATLIIYDTQYKRHSA